MDTVGSRLRAAREKRELSQTAFAQIAGVSKRAQINYEQGERSPDADYLARIADAGCDVLYILTGKRAGTTSTRVVSGSETVLSDRKRLEVAISAVEEGLAETRRKLPPNKKAELILAAYDLMAESKQSRDNVIRMVRAAA